MKKERVSRTSNKENTGVNRLKKKAGSNIKRN